MAYERYNVEAPKGVNFTLEPMQLPKVVWDNAYEVAFKHGKTKKVTGYDQGLGSSKGIMPYVMAPIQPEGSDLYRWAYATEAADGGKVYLISSKVEHNDVTPVGGIPLHPDYAWSTDSINSVPYITKTVPYMWNSDSGKFTTMKYFPTHLKANLMRTYKNHMICLDITTGAYDPSNVQANWMPHLTEEEKNDYKTKFGYWEAGTHSDAVWWSDEVIGGNLEVSWADGDPTSESGWNFLGGSGGRIIDGRTLRDSFIIYRERSVWQMTYIGGVNVFSWKEIFTDAGALALNCVTDIDGWHFVIGISDVYMHNGVQKKSVADGVVKDLLYKYIDPNHVDKVFLITKYNDREVWVCMPEPSKNVDGLCNIAFVYNWEEQTWSIREMPNTKCSMYTSLSISSEGLTWKSPEWDIAWSETPEVWVDAGFTHNPADWGVVFSGYDPEKKGFIYATDTSYFKDGVGFSAYVEKKWMDMDDHYQYKTINKIYPIVRKGVVNVFVAGTDSILESPVWKSVGVYDPQKKPFVPCRATGRFLHVRFEIPKDSAAEIVGYWVEFSRSGTR